MRLSNLSSKKSIDKSVMKIIFLLLNFYTYWIALNETKEQQITWEIQNFKRQLWQGIYSMDVGRPICLSFIMRALLCRYPVHKPSRPRLEPSGVQLDWQEGGTVREGQPDHTVWQVPPRLPGHPQIKVWEILSSSLSLWNVTLTVMPSWRRTLGCDITWNGWDCAKVGVMDRHKQRLTQKNWMPSYFLLYRTSRLLQHLHHHCYWSRQQQQEAEEWDTGEEYFVHNVKPNLKNAPLYHSLYICHAVC